MSWLRPVTVAAIFAALGCPVAHADIDVAGHWIGKARCKPMVDSTTSDPIRVRADVTLSFDGATLPAAPPGPQFAGSALFIDPGHGNVYYRVSLLATNTDGDGLVELRPMSDPPACALDGSGFGLLTVKANSKLKGLMYFTDSWNLWGACRVSLVRDPSLPGVAPAYCP